MDGVDLAEVRQMSADDLLLYLGMHLVAATEVPIRGNEQDDLRLRAENWLKRHWKELRQTLRDNPQVEALRSDETLLLVELATIIASHWITVPGAIYAAAIIVKLGLDKLCDYEEFPGKELS